RDDPDARFGTARTGHDAPDVVAIDLNGGARELTGITAPRRQERRHAQHEYRYRELCHHTHRCHLVDRFHEAVVRRPLDAPGDAADRAADRTHVDQHFFVLRAQRLDDLERNL